VVLAIHVFHITSTTYSFEINIMRTYDICIFLSILFVHVYVCLCPFIADAILDSLIMKLVTKLKVCFWFLCHSVVDNLWCNVLL